MKQRITENSQNCKKKIRNFQFWFIFKICFLVALQVSNEERILINLEYTKKKETRGLKYRNVYIYKCFLLILYHSPHFI